MAAHDETGDHHEHGHDHCDAHAHAHGHDHGGAHAHGHDDATGHGHQHGPAGHGHAHHGALPRNGELEAGAGRGKLLHFDAFSGMAGDMTIAALLDLGVPRRVVEDAVRCLPVEGYELVVGKKSRSGIVATTFDVEVKPGQPERRYVEIDRMLEASALPADVLGMARDIFHRLAVAEADVHGTGLEQVHFHEVGAVDSIVDIVGAAAALRWLGAGVSASPLPMGHGFVRARHGVLPLPAPATVSCLKGVPTYEAGIEAELVTPTGAAIVATVATRFVRWPSVRPERVGWGAGTKELPDRPNLLRAVLGEPAAEESATPQATHVVVEANVDDMTGELAARAIEVLLASGALDAWAEPIVMKKGRPGLTIAALGRSEQLELLSARMLAETSSIGVRHRAVSRTERPRERVEVETPFGLIPVKISGGPFGPPQIKPEFDACVRAAEHAKVPVREVLAAALVAARQRVGAG